MPLLSLYVPSISTYIPLPSLNVPRTLKIELKECLELLKGERRKPVSGVEAFPLPPGALGRVFAVARAGDGRGTLRRGRQPLLGG